MTVNVTNHLNFRGDARRALEFYRSVFGGQLVALTYAEAHRPVPSGEENLVMWGQVEADNGFRVMAYDVPSTMEWDQGKNSFFVSVRCSSTDEITAQWTALAEGARIVEDLAPAPWGAPLYGMLEDRFGVVWVMDVVADYTQA
nr:VOC family protein [Rhodococcus sp. (in: high G+C Gram-positive bacteria)]